MKKAWIISLAFVLSATLAHGQYFPKSSFDSRIDDLLAKWYSTQLRALQEPSLLALAKTPSAESYRFLWLRTFHHPIAIRLEAKSDGTGVLTTKVGSGAGGYAPGYLLEDRSRVLTKPETKAFLSHVNEVGFWQAPAAGDDPRRGNDGSEWIIEGVRGGQYHVLNRWSPADGIVRELGMMLAFDLAKLKIPKTEIY